MESSSVFYSPTSTARFYIMCCLSDCQDHSVADLKKYAIDNMSESMGKLCSRGVFSGIFTRLLKDGFAVAPRRGIYRITSPGLVYIHDLMQNMSADEDNSKTSDASSEDISEYKPASAVPDIELHPISACDTAAPLSRDFTAQLHAALGTAYHALEAACTFNVLRLSEQDFLRVRDVEDILSKIAALQQKTV